MTREEMLQIITQKLESQPVFVMKAIEWFVTHLDLAKMLCTSSKPLSDKKFEEELLKAIKTQDHAYYALLMYQKVLQKESEPEG